MRSWVSQTPAAMLLAMAFVFTSSAAPASFECTGTCATWNRDYFPHADSYSTDEQRSEWLTRLQEESQSTIQFDFGPLGQLMGFAGDVQLVSPSIDAVLQWVFSHRRELGMPDDVELRLTAEPKPLNTFSTEAEQVSGSRLTIEPLVEGIPVAGREVVVLVREGGDRVRGLYNGFVPATNGFIYASCGMSESEAWNVAQQELTTQFSALPEEPATVTWFEEGSVLGGAPTPVRQHWRLAAFDENGMLRRIFVDCDAQKVSLATPGEFSFSLPTKNNGYIYSETGAPNPAVPDVGAIYYDSVSLPAGCSYSLTTCSDPAYTDSHGAKLWKKGNLKDNLAAVVDFFYSESSQVSCSSGPVNQSIFLDRNDCFPWPFSGGFSKAPLDNGNREIFAVAANGYAATNGTSGGRPGGKCWVACNMGSYLGFIRERVDVDLVAHEYGHSISSWLGPSMESSFNESMSDLYGIVAGSGISADRYEAHGLPPPGPMFWVDDEGAYDCGWAQNPYAACSFAQMDRYTDWKLNTPAAGFTCAANARARIGHLFYQVWQDMLGYWGGGIENDYGDFRFFWRAWFINLMRSLEVAGHNFTTLAQFKAATTSRVETINGGPNSSVDILAYWTKVRLDQLYAGTTEPDGDICFR